VSGETYQRYFGSQHRLVRETVRSFVRDEILPHVDAWEEAGSFPRRLYRRAAELGILGVGYPETCGGVGGDVFTGIAVAEELTGSGSGGLVAGLGSHHIALPPIVRHGSDEQKRRFVAPVLAGERIAALAVTEPDAGSDVAGLRTTAVRDGEAYVVNGSKSFITSGCRADQVTVAVRTGGPGAAGISLLVVEAGTPGYSTSPPMKKMGWWASDTAQLFFDDCRVPVANRIGPENAGFKLLMENFQSERLQMVVIANATARLALDEALRYAAERRAFGRPLADFQVIRHRLADMATEVTISREFAYRVAAKIQAGVDQVMEVSMAKSFAAAVCERVTHAAVQIFGGYGYVREYPVERLFRDGRILSIGGGTSEIMKEIIAKRLLAEDEK